MASREFAMRDGQNAVNAETRIDELLVILEEYGYFLLSATGLHFACRSC